MATLVTSTVLNDEIINFCFSSRIIYGLLSISKKTDYNFALDKAFNDTFHWSIRSKYSKKYSKCKIDFKNEFFYYFNVGGIFNVFFKSETCLFNKRFGISGGLIGYAQKFICMTFKYLYCFSSSASQKFLFNDCYMPLDKYVLNWVRRFKEKSINIQLNRINNTWSKMSCSLYYQIQDFINKTLSKSIKYIVKYPRFGSQDDVVLPNYSIQAEFIIWHQEKLNEIKNQVDKLSYTEKTRIGF